MKALEYQGSYQLVLVEKAIPEVGPEDVLVRVKAVSVCGSDINGYRGKNSMRKAPLVMGHEFSGEIVKIGENVTEHSVGLRVAVDPNIYCGMCPDCLSGHSNVCLNRRIVGTTMLAGSCNGAMSEYVAVPKSAIHIIPDLLSYEEAACLEPFAVAYHAVKKAGDLNGKTIVVLGAGPIGLYTVICLTTCGAKTILSSDIVPTRLEKALECGATEAIDSRELDNRVKEMTCGRGADVVIDCVGFESTINQAITLVKNSGQIIVVGLGEEHISLNIKNMSVREVSMVGSYTYTTEFAEITNLVSLISLKLDTVITSIVSLADAPEAIKDLASGSSKEIKIIIRP